MAISNFPTEVQKRQAKGAPGDKASLNPVVYTERNYLAGDAAVTVGNFVWPDPGNAAVDSDAPGAFKALSSGAGLPLGLAERT